MPNSLRDRLGALAMSFAGSVLELVRGYSLEQFLEAAEGGGRTRPLKKALASGRLRQRGPKRATAYRAKSSSGRTAADASAAGRTGRGAKAKSDADAASRGRARPGQPPRDAGRGRNGRATGAPSRKIGPGPAPSVEAPEKSAGEAMPAAVAEISPEPA